MYKLPFLKTVLSILVIFSLLSPLTYVYSDEEYLESEIKKKEEQLEKNKSLLDEIEERIKEISSSNYTLTQQINLLNSEISELQAQIDAKDQEIQLKLDEIDRKEKEIAKKKSLVDMVSGDLYMQSRRGTVDFIFSVGSIEGVIQSLFVKRTAISILKDEITDISGEFANLSEIKEDLMEEKNDLDSQREGIQDVYDVVMAEKVRVQKELDSSNAQKSNVKRTINGITSELSDLQYQLLIVRQGGTHVDIDSVPSGTGGDVNGTLAGFRANAPSGSFAVFSIGAYTHRNGMSQWGARARADSGQSYSQILSHYYPGKTLRTGTVVINGSSRPIMSSIPVNGYGSIPFEENYLLGIQEVPEYWPMEVLKAQAIAARTYAIRYTNNGSNSICTTESCQVYSSSLKTGAWKTAVQATRGVILVNSDGTPALTQYAAVHGGWSNTSGWDTTDGSGSGSWMARAWDSISGVSWFYKTWYRYGYSSTGSTCSRTSWLNMSEMSDILNAYQVWIAKNKNDSRIVPELDACHSTGNPYTKSELRSLAAKPVTSISTVVTVNSNGSTQSVTFYTNAGAISMSGNDFKTIYNLRAPGHLRIPQSGFVHINVEKK